MMFKSTWNHAKSIANVITESGAKARELLKDKKVASYLAAAGGSVASSVGTTAAAIGTTTTLTVTTATIPVSLCGGTIAAGGTLTAAIAKWLGIPLMSTISVTTVPAWAAPLAVGGAVVVLGAGISLYINKKKQRMS